MSWRTGKNLTSLSLVIVAAGLLPYLAVIVKGFFLADDFLLLYYTKNVHFTQLSELLTVQVFYRPVVMLVWKIEYVLFGYGPAYYHLVNVLVNALNGCLLFYVIDTALDNRPLGFLAGLAFAVFPLHAEPVSWLSGQFDVFCVAFSFAALFAFGLYRKKGVRTYYLLSLLLFVLAVFSKEEAVILPLIVVLYDFLFFRKPASRKKLAVHLPFFALLGMYSLFRMAVFHGVGGYRNPAGGSQHLRFDYPAALRELAISTPFNFLYPVNRVFFPPSSIYIFWLTCLLLLFLLYSSRRDARQYGRTLVFALGLFIIACLPVLGILHVEPNLWNSRFLYLPSAGYCILIACLLFYGLKPFRLKLHVPALFIIALFGCLLYYNNMAWVNSSVKQKKIYLDVQRLSGRNLIVFLLEPEKYADRYDKYNGAYLPGRGDYSFGKTGGGAAVIPVKIKTGVPAASADFKDLILNFWSGGEDQEKVWPFYKEAEAITRGAASPEDLGFDAVLARYNRDTNQLDILRSSNEEDDLGSS